jgi:hypothetical protein
MTLLFSSPHDTKPYKFGTCHTHDAAQNSSIRLPEGNKQATRSGLITHDEQLHNSQEA